MPLEISSWDDVSLDNVMKALIIVGWPSYARLVRGDILSVREEDYVEAICVNHTMAEKKILRSLGRGL